MAWSNPSPCKTKLNIYSSNMVEMVPQLGSRKYDKITMILFLQMFGHAAFINQSQLTVLCHQRFCLIKAAWPKFFQKNVFFISLYLLFDWFLSLSTEKKTLHSFSIKLFPWLMNQWRFKMLPVFISNSYLIALIQQSY